jgi:hypothetical protein
MSVPLRKNWLITQQQIAAGDIEGAMIRVDPEQIPDSEIYGLHGLVRLRVEGATGPADIFANPQARIFFRALHGQWPWAGYFLRLAPVTLQSPAQQIIDLGTFMALAICHVDELTYIESPTGVCLKYNGDQLAKHLAELQGRAVELADATGISAAAIRERDALITDSVVSFFDSGTDLYHKQKRRKK